MSQLTTLPSEEEIQKKISEMTAQLSRHAESKEKQLFQKYLNFIQDMREKKHSYAAIAIVLKEIGDLEVSPATLKKWLIEATGSDVTLGVELAGPIANAIAHGKNILK